MYIDDDEPRIIWSAHRHGVLREDIIHAFRTPLWTGREGELRIVVGPNRAGNLLEIGVSDGRTDREVVVVHAMSARAKYLEKMYAPNTSRNHRSRRRTRRPL